MFNMTYVCEYDAAKTMGNEYYGPFSELVYLVRYDTFDQVGAEWMLHPLHLCS